MRFSLFGLIFDWDPGWVGLNQSSSVESADASALVQGLIILAYRLYFTWVCLMMFLCNDADLWHVSTSNICFDIDVLG